MAFNFLSNGMGGIDLGQGLENVAGMLGIEDIEMLMHRLLIIKSHRPDDSDDQL